MAELRPYPLASLIRRAFYDLKHSDGIYDLPRRKFFKGSGERDYSVSMHGHRAATALGPAAGPQTQMAQNLLLSWLGGCRIMELKTVQINDELVIPRPCIDMQTIGYNVEWSQELKLQQSLEEYVKGSMLIDIIRASGRIELDSSAEDLIFDMSVGYDLAGIKSPAVQAFIDGMMDCSEIVERLRSEIPEEYKQYRDLPFKTCLSDTLTLSTFHGCPPDEIERICEFLLEEKGLHTIVKLNPTLLGEERARELLNQTMGYGQIVIPDSAFENDTRWEQAVAFVGRLGNLAKRLNKGFGVKFSNTLLVDNHRDFFPADEKSMYLSGPPLHVLAMNLVRQFRQKFGDLYPISFSAGIDRNNFSDAVAIGLKPVTVCSDLLKPGGYGRASGYLDELGKRMDKVGAQHVDDYVIRAYGKGQEALESLGLGESEQRRLQLALEGGADLREQAGEHYDAWVSKARLLNTEHYVEACTNDARYSLAKNSKPPKKVGSHLELFECVSCNKCLPVCPNDANFALPVPAMDKPILKANKVDGAWTTREDGSFKISKKMQYANFADFCNECGNCDVFCPEDGGPYLVKPRFFGNLEDYREMKDHDGFYFEPGGIESGGQKSVTHARIGGAEFTVKQVDNELVYAGDGFELSCAVDDIAGSLQGSGEGEVDLSYLLIVLILRDAVFSSSASNYLRHL